MCLEMQKYMFGEGAVLSCLSASSSYKTTMAIHNFKMSECPSPLLDNNYMLPGLNNTYL